MPPYASPPTASWSRKEAIPLYIHAPVDWSYAPRNFRPPSIPAARHARRHNPHSIATMRIKVARDISATPLLPRRLCKALLNYL